MPEIDKLVISVKLDSSKFKQDLDKLKKSLESLPKNLGKINESVKNVFNEKTTIDFGKKFTKLTQSFKDTVTNISSDSKKLSDTIQKTFQYKFFKDIDNNTKKSESIISNSVKNISNILESGLKGFGTYFGAKFATDFIKGIVGKGANIQFLSNAFNVKTNNLQRVQQLFELIGGSAESASAAIAQLYNRMNSPADVSLSMGFKKLGLLRYDEKGNKKDPATLILEAIKKASALPERQRNTALQFLGLPAEAQVLTNNPKLFNTYLKMVDKNNSIRSDKEIADQAMINAKFIMLGHRWDNIKSIVLDKIMPVLEILTSQVEKVLHISPKKLKNDTKLISNKQPFKEGVINHYKKQFQEFKNMKFDFGKISQSSPSNMMPMKKTKKAVSSAFDLNAVDNEVVPPIEVFNNKKWHKYTPSPAQLLPQNNTTNTTNQQQVSMNIGNISVPNITNANQFTKELHKMALTGYGFSGNLLA